MNQKALFLTPFLAAVLGVWSTNHCDIVNVQKVERKKQGKRWDILACHFLLLHDWLYAFITYDMTFNTLSEDGQCFFLFGGGWGGRGLFLVHVGCLVGSNICNHRKSGDWSGHNSRVCCNLKTKLSTLLRDINLLHTWRRKKFKWLHQASKHNWK